jgi:hypothetical protein
VTLPEPLRETAGSLADDLEMAQNPGLNQFIPLERRTSEGGVLLDGVGRLDDVL